jgi:hypothetical protein
MLFEPCPSVGKRQDTCSSAECQKQRRRQTQAAWRERNPDYFKGLYEMKLKPWLEQNPEYLAGYRGRRRGKTGPNSGANSRCARAVSVELDQARNHVLGARESLEALLGSLSGIEAGLRFDVFQDQQIAKPGIQTCMTGK